MNNITYCYRCGAQCGAPGFPIMGWIGGEPWCDICIGNVILGRFEDGLDDIVYISTDGRTFTTFGGTKLGTVHELGGKGGTWSAQQLDKFLARLPVPAVHWSGVTEDGVLVYGRTMGHGMAATAHVRRRKGRIVVEAGSRIALGR